jgi:RNA polymerase sigma-70 factor (ECF subfamily)
MDEGEHKNKSLDFKNYLEQAKQLDRDSFELVYSKYLTPIYRYFVIRTSDKNLSQDLAHSVFIKAWKNSQKIEDLEKILPWLFTIARNTLIDHWRKKKEVLVDDVSSMEAAGDMQNIEEEHDYSEQLKKAKKALLKLSDDQRELVTLKFFEELTNEEICVITGKSSVAVRALQHRALKSLKKILEDEG